MKGPLKVTGTVKDREKFKYRQDRASGLLFRKHNGDLGKVSKDIGLSVATLKGRIQGDRKAVLMAKGELTEEEEKELNEHLLFLFSKEPTPERISAKKGGLK